MELPKLPIRASQRCWEGWVSPAGCGWLSQPSQTVHISGWIPIYSGLMGLLFSYYPISFLLFSLPGFKGISCISCSEQRIRLLFWAESTIQHLWANPSATWSKCLPSPLSMSKLFLDNKWHFTGMTEHHISIKQACILDWLKSRCMNREVFFNSLLHLSHSLAWGWIEFQRAAQEVGKRNSLDSYVQVFYASEEKNIGGIITMKYIFQMYNSRCWLRPLLKTM